jgi:hypothetical protein
MIRAAFCVRRMTGFGGRAEPTLLLRLESYTSQTAMAGASRRAFSVAVDRSASGV